ncbi:exonuclease domain-containing protein [Rufibacter sp. LB8]|uniref:exonuclease domain-containing protein n=1 Tax=Rufibacter sp. LB8 TaxID=2777781 RepID=UPI00178C5A61|nr:exonuclease domain-containing protein [Rufibacter sp. LB8]
MKGTFTAIDFETAHGKRWSICQVGLVRYENGVLKRKINKLVCPPENYYHYRNSEIHGLTAGHTFNAPSFAEVWIDLKPYIENQTVVAHNGAFDFSCLKQALEYYQTPQPVYHQQCTYKMYGKGLAELCKEYKIKLNHHDALSDAMACADLYLKYLKEN